MSLSEMLCVIRGKALLEGGGGNDPPKHAHRTEITKRNTNCVPTGYPDRKVKRNTELGAIYHLSKAERLWPKTN